MALLIYTDGSKSLHNKPGDEERLFKVWQVITGRKIPDSHELTRFSLSVKQVILNWRTAPEEYVRAHLQHIIPQAVAEWVVDGAGTPLRPSTPWGYEFARKYGLYRGNKPTNLVTKRQIALL
jgi:hypothetical protein